MVKALNDYVYNGWTHGVIRKFSELYLARLSGRYNQVFWVAKDLIPHMKDKGMLRSLGTPKVVVSFRDMEWAPNAGVFKTDERAKSAGELGMGPAVLSIEKQDVRVEQAVNGSKISQE